MYMTILWFFVGNGVNSWPNLSQQPLSCSHKRSFTCIPRMLLEFPTLSLLLSLPWNSSFLSSLPCVKWVVQKHFSLFKRLSNTLYSQNALGIQTLSLSFLLFLSFKVAMELFLFSFSSMSKRLYISL